MTERMVTIVHPAAEDVAPRLGLAPRLASLHGARVALIDNSKHNADVFLDALAVDVELRQASLFGQGVWWCSNLAAPDMLYNWSGWMPDMINRGEGIFGLGPYLNVLPLITIGLFLLRRVVRY